MFVIDVPLGVEGGALGAQSLVIVAGKQRDI